MYFSFCATLRACVRACVCVCVDLSLFCYYYALYALSWFIFLSFRSFRPQLSCFSLFFLPDFCWCYAQCTPFIRQTNATRATTTTTTHLHSVVCLMARALGCICDDEDDDEHSYLSRKRFDAIHFWLFGLRHRTVLRSLFFFFFISFSSFFFFRSSRTYFYYSYSVSVIKPDPHKRWRRIAARCVCACVGCIRSFAYSFR